MIAISHIARNYFFDQRRSDREHLFIFIPPNYYKERRMISGLLVGIVRWPYDYIKDSSLAYCIVISDLSF